MRISLIAALAHNNVIGSNNQLPWHMPNDMQYFKRMTLAKPVIMGRKNFEAMGKPLPGRHNIVITRDQHYLAKGCDVVHSLPEAIKSAGEVAEIMIIGGAEIYKLALSIVDRMYLTFIDADIQGDTFFPEWDQNVWQEISCESFAADEKNPYAYKFMVFDRK